LHLDTLERHLIHEITLRSSAFFSALSNLQDLHSESASCLTRIAELQTSLKDVGSTQGQKGLEIIDAQEQLRILRLTEKGIKTVAEVEDLMKVAHGLVEAGDWAGGLSCLSDVMSWWETHGGVADSGKVESVGLALASLPAVSSLPDSITRLTSAIAAQLESAFSSLLSSILVKADPGTTFDKEDFRASAATMIAGLTRCGKASGIEDTWREVMTTSIREGSRKVCPCPEPSKRVTDSQHLPVSQAEEDGDEEGRPPEARGYVSYVLLLIELTIQSESSGDFKSHGPFDIPSLIHSDEQHHVVALTPWARDGRIDTGHCRGVQVGLVTRDSALILQSSAGHISSFNGRCDATHERHSKVGSRPLRHPRLSLRVGEQSSFENPRRKIRTARTAPPGRFRRVVQGELGIRDRYRDLGKAYDCTPSRCHRVPSESCLLVPLTIEKR